MAPSPTRRAAGLGPPDCWRPYGCCGWPGCGVSGLAVDAGRPIMPHLSSTARGPPEIAVQAEAHSLRMIPPAGRIPSDAAQYTAEMLEKPILPSAISKPHPCRSLGRLAGQPHLHVSCSLAVSIIPDNRERVMSLCRVA